MAKSVVSGNIPNGLVSLRSWGSPLDVSATEGQILGSVSKAALTGCEKIGNTQKKLSLAMTCVPS